MSYFRRDCLSIKSNKILANLFAELIILSEKVQSFRQIIASVPYYDCVELFRVLDKEEKGFLTLKDFSRLMGDTHKKVVTYAFSWFDQAKLGEVSRLQFIAFLMPRRNQDLREMVARRIQQPSPQENFSSTINEQLRIFTELLNQMISHELKIIEQRKQLLKQDDYSIKGVLNSLDVNAHEFVSTKDIFKFLRNYAIEATTQQLKDFLEIVDSKLEGKVTLEQLKWIVEGLQDQKSEYREKVRNSSKKRGQSTKRESTKKTVQKQIEAQHLSQEVKQFVRTPQRSKKENYSSKLLQEEQLSKESKFSNTQSNFNQSGRFQSISKQDESHISQVKKESRNQSVQRRQELLKKSGYKQENSEFEAILKKYRQAESQAIKKDAELILAEQEIKQKLRDEFNQRSNSRRRAITESNSITSESYRKPMTSNYENDPSKDYVREYAKQQDYSRQSLGEKPTQKIESHIYQYPYTSKYDNRINTLVDNFYRRNNTDTAPFHYSQKRHGTVSSSFYDRLADVSYGTESHERYATRRKFLEDELEKQRQKDKVRPFDYRQNNLVKEEINKKLGDDIYNIKLPTRAYDALAHQARQRPLEESIRRMKESTERLEQQRQRMGVSNGMMENISIISRESLRKGEETGKKSEYGREVNVFRTEVKQNPVSSSSSMYQTVYNGDTKSRGQRTTQTKYSYAQTDSKMTPSLLRIQEQSSLHQ